MSVIDTDDRSLYTNCRSEGSESVRVEVRTHTDACTDHRSGRDDLEGWFFYDLKIIRSQRIKYAKVHGGKERHGSKECYEDHPEGL